MKNSTQEIAEALAALRAKFETLARALQAAAEVLRSPGRPPSEEVAAEMNQARQSFLEICNRIEKLQPRASAPIPTSLDEIENGLRQLEQGQRAHVLAATRELLERVLRFQHRDGRLKVELQ